MKFGELHVVKMNAVHLQIAADQSILKELSDFFSFEIPGAQFSPKVKYGLWDGRKRLFNLMTQTLPVGLYSHLIQFAADRDYKIIEYDRIHDNQLVDIGSYKEFIGSLDLHSDGEIIKPRYFQDTSIIHCLTEKRATIVSPTSSGKSLIIYSLSEYYRREGKRILLIVPTVALVLQMYSDFKDYSSEIDWNVSDYCHRIYSGQEKNTLKPITISTWQSMQKCKPEYFKKFDVVMCDEVHGAKADEIGKIMNASTNAHIRFGFTGTLQDTECHSLVIQGHFGKSKKIVDTRTLMDEGYVADLSIKILMLKYSQESRKELRKLTNEAKKKSRTAGYPVEMDYVMNHPSRMKQVLGLCKATKGNTLVLFQKIDHGKKIKKMICNNTEKVVYYISGEIKAEERERIRKQMEKEDNVVLIASYGTFSTGVSVKNIHNVVFASPSKSKIKVLQSIGRGLRKSKTKLAVTLFDIVDELTFKARVNSYPNYIIKHFWERWKFYKEEKFKVKLYERNIK